MTKNKNEKNHYQEVEVRRLGAQTIDGKRVVRFEKHKVLRPVVKITPAEAEAINSGRKEHPDNLFFIMYLKPDEEIEPLIFN